MNEKCSQCNGHDFKMTFYGLAWSCMALYYTIWPFMVLYGLLWSFMAKYRFDWIYIFFSRGYRSKFIWFCYTNISEWLTKNFIIILIASNFFKNFPLVWLKSTRRTIIDGTVKLISKQFSLINSFDIRDYFFILPRTVWISNMNPLKYVLKLMPSKKA